MKNLIKRNLLSVFALGLALTTMSFKMAEKTQLSEYWFLVENGDEIGAPTTPPSPSEDCQYYNEKEMCKVSLNTDTPPSSIETVQDAKDNGYFVQAASRTP